MHHFHVSKLPWFVMDFLQCDSCCSLTLMSNCRLLRARKLILVFNLDTRAWPWPLALTPTFDIDLDLQSQPSLGHSRHPCQKSRSKVNRFSWESTQTNGGTDRRYQMYHRPASRPIMNTREQKTFHCKGCAICQFSIWNHRWQLLLHGIRFDHAIAPGTSIRQITVFFPWHNVRLAII